MDPVSSLNQIALVLRQQLLEKAKLRGTAAAPSLTSRPSTQSGSSQIAADTHAAMEALLDASAENSLNALRRVVHLTLRQELGTEFENDAGFQRIVDSVTTAIHEDPSFIEDLRGRGR